MRMKSSSILLGTLMAACVYVGCASVSLSPLATHSDDGGADAALDLAPDAAHVVGPPDLQAPPCTSNAQCAASPLGAVCNTASGLCVQCVTTDDTCDTGKYCTASNTCAVGCKVNGDCTSVDGGTTTQTCNTSTHLCVGCVQDSDCQPGTVCSTQTCVPGCNANHACETGDTCCSGQCANLMNDATNCGGCGNTCDTVHSVGATCASGDCAYTGCVTNFADCVTTAPDTDGCETSATTTQNCGKCGSCDTGGIIKSSSCVVPQMGEASCEYQCGCSTAANEVASACNGTSCSYTCASGNADCNAGTGADTDGCECATASSSSQGTAGCCASGTCQTVHDDGFSDNFYDCVADGVYNAMQALEAAAAATSVTGTASDGWTCGSSGNMGYGVCKQSASTCACWIYNSTGSIAATGHVHYNSGSSSCFCATSSDPSWN